MFDEYYTNYLGIDKAVQIDDCMVCKSVLRDLPLNKRYIYRIIISDYNGYRIVSVSNTISENVINNICRDIKNKNLNDIINSQQLIETNLRIRKMYRMIFNDICADSDGARGKYKCEYLNEYKKYVIRDSGNIISYCKISNVNFNYGNTVVWTDKKHRRMGYAKELLLQIISKCKEEGIEPLYLVDSKNQASIELAKSVGFKIAQEEIVACELIGF